jgi:putative DNA primase/helicase
LIPFEVNIPPEKVDKNLKYNLRNEYPQILAWAVEGCIKWQQTGSLAEPETVIDAVKEYRQEMDLIAAFMEQCVVIDYASGAAVKGSDLFAVYRAWAKENNEWEMTNNRFGREMAKKVPEKVKTSKGVEYRGIRLTDYALKLVPRQYRIEDFS